jgi:hypothetical protein
LWDAVLQTDVAAVPDELVADLHGRRVALGGLAHSTALSLKAAGLVADLAPEAEINYAIKLMRSGEQYDGLFRSFVEARAGDHNFVKSVKNAAWNDPERHSWLLSLL